MSSLPLRCLLILAVGQAVVAPARAQWAVIDAPAIVQLVQQVQTMQEELQTTKAQLSQARQALLTETGDRGMELLLNGSTRNYLPSSWPELAAAMQGSGYTGLSGQVRGAIGANAVLSPGQLALLSTGQQTQIFADRRVSALQQAVAQDALSNASARFASLQTLISAISSAADQKAILDLQARIGAELGMLQNEQTKLQILHQATLAQESVNTQQAKERAVAAQGRFETRFQPIP